MTTDTTTTKDTEVKVADKPQDSSSAPVKKTFVKKSFGGKKPFRKGGRRKFGDRPKPEFEQKILSIRRVTRVMAGGRRFSFSVTMLIGDKKGRVGVGLGKSSDTTMAITKAVSDAKKNMIRIKTTKDMSIDHNIEGKFKASRVTLMPNKGKGLVVGGALRDICLLAGLKNMTGKILSRSKTHLNNAKATIEALKTLGVAEEPKVEVKKVEEKPTDKKEVEKEDK